MQVPKEQLCKLLAHGLPPGVTEADLCSLLPASAPPLVRVEGDCSTEKKVLLVFHKPQDANLAFKELQVISPCCSGFLCSEMYAWCSIGQITWLHGAPLLYLEVLHSTFLTALPCWMAGNSGSGQPGAGAEAGKAQLRRWPAAGGESEENGSAQWHGSRARCKAGQG